MSAQRAVLEQIVRRDPRYRQEAYEFVFEGLAHAQASQKRRPGGKPPRDVSARQLVEGLCGLAHREFGLLARTVFRLWGIERTSDFGDIVYNLIEARQMSRTERDSRQDFDDLFDLDEVLVNGYQIDLESTDAP